MWALLPPPALQSARTLAARARRRNPPEVLGSPATPIPLGELALRAVRHRQELDDPLDAVVVLDRPPDLLPVLLPGGLAQQQALGVPPETERDVRQQAPDEERRDGVERVDAGDLGQPDAQESDRDAHQ